MTHPVPRLALGAVVVATATACPPFDDIRFAEPDAGVAEPPQCAVVVVDHFNAFSASSVWQEVQPAGGLGFQVVDGALVVDDRRAGDNDAEAFLAAPIPAPAGAPVDATTAPLDGIVVEATVASLPPPDMTLVVALTTGDTVLGEITIDDEGHASAVAGANPQALGTVGPATGISLTAVEGRLQFATTDGGTAALTPGPVDGQATIFARIGARVVGPPATATATALFADARVMRGPCDDICHTFVDEEFSGANLGPDLDLIAGGSASATPAGGLLTLHFTGQLPSGEVGVLWTPPTGTLLHKVVTVALPRPPATPGTQLFVGLNDRDTADFDGLTLQYNLARDDDGADVPVDLALAGPVWVRARFEDDVVHFELSEDGQSFHGLVDGAITTAEYAGRQLLVFANQFGDGRLDATDVVLDGLVVEDASCVPTSR